MKQETEVHQTMLTLEQLLMMADAVNATDTGARAETATVIWIQVALLVYLAGIVFFAFRNVYSLVRLLMLLKSGKRGYWQLLTGQERARYFDCTQL